MTALFSGENESVITNEKQEDYWGFCFRKGIIVDKFLIIHLFRCFSLRGHVLK